MCTNGINTTQFEQLIDQIDDYVALQVRHTHKLAHAADNAGYENCHLKLHAASDMLAEVRNLLDEAKFALSTFTLCKLRNLMRCVPRSLTYVQYASTPRVLRIRTRALEGSET